MQISRRRPQKEMSSLKMKNEVEAPPPEERPGDKATGFGAELTPSQSDRASNANIRMQRLAAEFPCEGERHAHQVGNADRDCRSALEQPSSTAGLGLAEAKDGGEGEEVEWCTMWKELCVHQWI